MALWAGGHTLQSEAQYGHVNENWGKVGGIMKGVGSSLLIYAMPNPIAIGSMGFTTNIMNGSSTNSALISGATSMGIAGLPYAFASLGKGISNFVNSHDILGSNTYINIGKFNWRGNLSIDQMWIDGFSGFSGKTLNSMSRFLGTGAALDSYFASSQGGGPGWEAFVGAAGTAVSEMYYSEKYGTWMGKNFKMYKQTWGGNGFTGGKNKFGKTTSNAIKWGGRALGAWNAYSIQSDYAAGEMGTGWMLAEQGTNAFSTLGGIYGAAWGVGWELGRGVTNMGWYQEAKFNFWYNRWENQVGAPSQSNEALWYYFYQNYKP